MLSRQTVGGKGVDIQTLSHAVSAQESLDVQAVPPSSRGICDIGSTCGTAHDERFSVVGGVAASLFSAPFTPKSEHNSTVDGGSPVMEGTICADVGHPLAGGVVHGDHDNGHLLVGVGCDADKRDS